MKSCWKRVIFPKVALVEKTFQQFIKGLVKLRAQEQARWGSLFDICVKACQHEVEFNIIVSRLSFTNFLLNLFIFLSTNAAPMIILSHMLSLYTSSWVSSAFDISWVYKQLQAKHRDMSQTMLICIAIHVDFKLLSNARSLGNLRLNWWLPTPSDGT